MQKNVEVINPSNGYQGKAECKKISDRNKIVRIEILYLSPCFIVLLTQDEWLRTIRMARLNLNITYMFSIFVTKDNVIIRKFSINKDFGFFRFESLAAT